MRQLKAALGHDQATSASSSCGRTTDGGLLMWGIPGAFHSLGFSGPKLQLVGFCSKLACAKP
jgi:hypothetical protein